MRTIFFLLLLSMSFTMVSAQQKDEPVYRIVEMMPTIGDCSSLEEETARTRCTMERIIFHIQSEVVYPEELKEFGVEGTVYVNFVVGKSGDLRDVKVIRGVEGSLDEEALRVVRTLPKFNPGKQAGKPVAVEYTIPIQFKLSEDQDEDQIEEEE